MRRRTPGSTPAAPTLPPRATAYLMPSHHAGLEFIDQPLPPLDAGGEGIADQAIFGVVRNGDGFVVRVESDDRQDGAENILPQDSAVPCDIGEHRGRSEERRVGKAGASTCRDRW